MACPPYKERKMIMKKEKKRIGRSLTMWLTALMTFCLVLAGMLLIAPLGVEAAGDNSPANVAYITLEDGQGLQIFLDGYLIATNKNNVETTEFSSHTGSYVIMGRTDRQVSFESATYETATGAQDFAYSAHTYTVTFHAFTLQGLEGEYALTISPGTTLNAAVYGINWIESLKKDDKFIGALNKWSRSNATNKTGTATGNFVVYPNSEILFYVNGGSNSDIAIAANGEEDKVTASITRPNGTTVGRKTYPSNTSGRLYQEGTPVAHTETLDATCSKGKSCAVCGLILNETLEPNGHVWIAPCSTVCNEGCGETRAAGEHTYTNCCDEECNVSECVAENRTISAHVHVGDASLSHGQYVDLNGNVTEEKPEGGYAYFAVDADTGENLLTLREYRYTGSGFCFDPENELYALLFTRSDLTVKIEGDVRLDMSNSTALNCEGILSLGSLSIKGEDSERDSLAITTHGSVIFSEGDLSISDLSVEAEGIDGLYSLGDIHVTDCILYFVVDCGIIAYSNEGEVSVQSSDLMIFANTGGINANSISVDQSKLFILSPYDSMYAYSISLLDSEISLISYNIYSSIYCFELTVENCDLSVRFETNGEAAISAEKSIAIIGGTLTVVSQGEAAISCGSSFSIENGTVLIDCLYYGITLREGPFSARNSTIEFLSRSPYPSIFADTVSIDGGSATSSLYLAECFTLETQNDAELVGVVRSFIEGRTCVVYGEIVINAGQFFDLSTVFVSVEEIKTILQGARIDGIVFLPDNIFPADLAELEMSGNGLLVFSQGGACSPLGEAALEALFLDLTNVGDDEGQTPAQGKGYSWNQAEKTLTLTNATIGVILFPTGDVTVVLNGYNFVSGLHISQPDDFSWIFSGNGTIKVMEPIYYEFNDLYPYRSSITIEEGATLLATGDILVTSLRVYGKLIADYRILVDSKYGSIILGKDGEIVGQIMIRLSEKPNHVEEALADVLICEDGHCLTDGTFLYALSEYEELYYIFSAHKDLKESEYAPLIPYRVTITSTAHDFSGEWQKDADGHWRVCAIDGCEATEEKAAHVSAGAATETDPEICSICAQVISPALGHQHRAENEWQKNETHHWHTCSGCEGQELDKSAHTDTDNNGKCDTCAYQMRADHVEPGTDPVIPGTDPVIPGTDPVQPNAPVNPDTDPEPQPPADPDPSDGNDGLGAGAIAAIAIGSVAAVGGGGFALWWFIFRKKKIM